MDAAQDYVIVIPARYASQRLPGKALLDIGGKSLLEHVWLRARASSAADVVIATDDRRIVAAADGFGARAIMTSPDHASGSDRIAECAGLMAWPAEQVIVNLQGDEPLMPPECLDQVAALLGSQAEADVATLYWPVSGAREAADPNAVKVVVGQGGQALFFSRATIPHPRDYPSVREAFADGVTWYRHLGLYAYRKASLDRFTGTEATPLEQAERLEQLRFLESGGRIAVAQARVAIPAGVDTPEDLERVRNSIKV